MNIHPASAGADQWRPHFGRHTIEHTWSFANSGLAGRCPICELTTSQSTFARFGDEMCSCSSAGYDHLRTENGGGLSHRFACKVGNHVDGMVLPHPLVGASSIAPAQAGFLEGQHTPRREEMWAQEAKPAPTISLGPGRVR